jgi:16S rRNA processing protein RimM
MTEIFLRRRTEWVKMKIIATSFVGGRPVLKFEGINTPEDAARLVNLDLAVPRSQMFKLPEGSFYISDLIDCDVIDAVGGQRIGKIKDIEQFPANDVYVVEKLDGRSARVAATKDFVKEIDINGKRVLIDTDGMSDDT